jgi:Dehydratase family
MLGRQLRGPVLVARRVLKQSGPIGAPGMPEWGMLPMPRRLLEAGVRDIVRISDSRMSGTSYGTCVLHVAPESAVGGPLSGYGELFVRHVMQANLGCDFDFLHHRDRVPEPLIY